MRAGRLDRKILIQRNTLQWLWDAEWGGWYHERKWLDIATVQATVVQTGGREFRDRLGTVGERRASFTTRYLNGVTILDRVIYGTHGDIWDIVDIKEIGRRRGLELNCTNTGQRLYPPQDPPQPGDPDESPPEPSP